MATINLLPWREERRQLIKKQFLVVLGGVALLSVLLVVLAMSIVNGAISHQEGRNAYLQGHITTLPDGLFYTSVSRRGSRIDVQGIAESNNRVSSLMRKLDASPWFADPNLTAVSAASAYGDQASSFKLSYKISAPAPDDEK